MRIKLFLLATGLALSFVSYSKDYTVKSPDNKVVITVSVNNDIRWSVSYEGKQIIEPSVASMSLASGPSTGAVPVVAKATINEFNGVLKPVLPHKNRTITDHYFEMVLRFKSGCSMIFRAYNDGAAYRYATSLKGDIKVMDETFTMALPSGTTAFYPLEQRLMSHNECTFFPASMDTITQKHLASLPVLFKSKGVNILLSESDINDYPGMWVTGDGQGGVKGLFPAYPAKEEALDDRDIYVTERENYIASTTGTRSFPWRVIIISPTDGGLIESDMIYRLAAPCKIADTQWIKPGKVAWDWWNAVNIYGVNFKAGLNNDTYKYYIDFASKNGIQYVILDEGWYKIPDVLDVSEGLDIKELCDYAKDKNVGIILWVIWKSLDDKIDEALAQYEAWGVKGIKVDFMQRDDQWMVNYYHKVAQKASEHHMLVDFHGAYKPNGLERTWPNVITSEGVKGLEHDKWSKDITPVHDVTLPFTRMVAGPMDFTPGAMRNMQKRDFNPTFYRPASQGTRVHQMAMYVVYESPLMMMADSPSNYTREQECTRFISGVPVVWDETKVLAAEVGKYVVIARRSGATWYLAAMTDWAPRTVEADLSFLPEGEYYVSFFADGINADRFAEDYRVNNIRISDSRKVTISMAPGGGWVGMIYSGELTTK